MSFKASQKEHSDIIDIKDLIGVILNRKLLVITSVIIFILVTFFYGLSRQPKYKSNLLLNIENNSASESISNILSDSMPFMQNKSSLSSKVQEIIKSRTVLVPVINKLHLNVISTPKTLPIIGPIIKNYNSQYLEYGEVAKPFLGMSSYDWGGSYINVSQFTLPTELYEKVFTLTALDNQNYSLISPDNKVILKNAQINKIYNVRIENGDILNIKINKIVANKGTVFKISKSNDMLTLNRLTKNLNIQSESGGSNIMRLSYRGSNPEKIASILNTLGSSVINNDIKRKSKNAQQVLSFLRSQIKLVQSKLNKTQAKLNNYRSKTGNLSVSTQTKIILQKLAAYNSQISELELKLSQLSEVLTAKNPELLQLKSAISKVKSQKSELEGKIKSLPTIDQLYVNLSRDVKIQENVYQTIVNKIQKYEIIQAATVSNLEIIDKADIPYENINTPLGILVILGAVLGFIFSVTWVFLQNHLIKGIQDPEVIEDILNLPSLGMVYLSKIQQSQTKKTKNSSAKKLKLIHEVDPHDIVLESFRSIRTAVELKRLSSDNNYISISGPTESIGKSFITANLAYSIASSGRRVLIIDADMRKGHLNDYFNTNANHGLSDYLCKEKISTTDIIKKTRFESVDFISCGNYSSNSSELLMSNCFSDLLASTGKLYDFILIDTPPVLPVEDANIILQQTAINFLVLRCSSHDKKTMKLMLSKLHNASVITEGFILNGVTANSSYYHKQYQYKSYR